LSVAAAAGDALLSPVPVVRLENAFRDPFNNAIATARTCYSSRVVFSADVVKDERAVALRDEIAKSTYEAGHHTTIQHATFQFVLEKVSRQFLWSFLHAHPFYNSEQVSQRYVEVKPGNFTVPPLPSKSQSRYLDLMNRQMEAYHRLIQLLLPDVGIAFGEIFPGRKARLEKWQPNLKKKAQEIARYVLPVATHAHLYHTVSGLTIHRYHRASQISDVPLETKLVVQAMVDEVNRQDPLFFRDIEDEIPLEETVEWRSLQEFKPSPGSARGFLREFDADLGPRISKLIDWSANGEASVARAVRTVLGLTAERLPDAAAIDRVLDPSQNRYLGGALNLTTLSKLTRALHHAHYSFRKKLSHTADSQDQRHRMAPASRPMLSAQYAGGEPDVIVPDLVRANAEALDLYMAVCRETWKAIDDLLADGVSAESALYLLPNAFPIRFEESGDLLNLHHKWHTRLCYTAQEEIWRCSLEEVQQVREVHPRIGNHIGPPCHLRQTAGVKPLCPEGTRYCGVPVWRVPLDEMKRTL
jgi:thymidylate synthase ThyX